MTAQLQWFLDRRTTNGLVNAREFVYFGNPLLYRVCEGATLNAFLNRALQDASFLADQLGRTDQATIYRDAAEALRRAVNDHLWDAARGTYFGSLTDGQATPPTAHAALFCLHFGIVPPERDASTRRWLLANYQQEGFYPYTHQYLLEAVYRAETDATDREALEIIRSRWTAMARSETGTVWEGFGPGENCHEAGAVPAYFLSAYVLGVRLDGPVSARRLLIQPRLGDLTEAEGTVVTELGPVPVRWRRDVVESKLDFDFEIPDGVRATVALPLPGEKPQVRINGQGLTPADWKIEGRGLLLELGPGVHRGQCSHHP